jgi:hypothetical protein
MLAVFGQLFRGKVALLVGGAGQYLLRGLPGGVTALAELVERNHCLGSLPGRWPPPGKSTTPIGKIEKST